ncbi:hypothetical protein CDL15_Pgr027656 [Punica granatum]|uniref:Uncharacterized protein n=1 Tax=Punica granatum TaxID=22663 RepID=A0A218XJJ4_PUNGR|nr:hypothetical protein CDL15_Pgr027656 [Punica granatum]PKI74888.1 hypothetical protein CRG98_004660 [Punica granatum]
MQASKHWAKARIGIGCTCHVSGRGAPVQPSCVCQPGPTATRRISVASEIVISGSWPGVGRGEPKGTKRAEEEYKKRPGPPWVIQFQAAVRASASPRGLIPCRIKILPRPSFSPVQFNS